MPSLTGKLVQINIWPGVVADEVDMLVVVLEPEQNGDIQEVGMVEYTKVDLGEVRGTGAGHGHPRGGGALVNCAQRNRLCDGRAPSSRGPSPIRS